MARFWISWWSGYHADEGCTRPPFVLRCSGIRSRADTEETERNEGSYCAVIDTEGQGAEARITAAIKNHFPDAEMRLIEARANDWQSGDRFSGFDAESTKLTEREAA